MNSPQSGQRFVQWVTRSVGTNILIALTGVLTGVITARILGASERGLMAAIQLPGALLAGVCTSGIPHAVLYYAGYDPTRSDDYYLNGLLAALLQALPLVILGYAIIPFWLDRYDGQVVTVARIYLLFVPLGVVTATTLAVFQGRGQITLWNALRLFMYTAWILPLVWIASQDGRTVSASFLTRVYLAFVAGCAVIYLVVYARGRTQTVQPDVGLLRRLVAYASRTTFSNLAQQSNLKLDQIIMASRFPASVLGGYAVAVAWSGASAPLVNSVSGVIVPFFSSTPQHGERGGQIAKIHRVMVLANGMITLLLILGSSYAIEMLFGSQFHEAISLSRILLIGSFFSNLKSLLAEVLRSANHPMIVTRGEGFGLLILTLLLIPSVLLRDAHLIAWGSTVAHIATYLYLLRQAVQWLGHSMSEMLFLNRSDILNAWAHLTT